MHNITRNHHHLEKSFQDYLVKLILLFHQNLLNNGFWFAKCIFSNQKLISRINNGEFFRNSCKNQKQN